MNPVKSCNRQEAKVSCIPLYYQGTFQKATTKIISLLIATKKKMLKDKHNLKGSTDVYTGNCKTLLKEIKEDIKRWEPIPLCEPKG